MTQYYYSHQTNELRQIDRMPPEFDKIETGPYFDVHKLQQDEMLTFHAYLSTLQPITHTFSGESRVVLPDQIEWRYEVWDGNFWKEVSSYEYSFAQVVNKRRVATPKITEGGKNDSQDPHKTKRISIPEYNASATVTEDCPPEVIDALKEMCRLAYYGTAKANREDPITAQPDRQITDSEGVLGAGC